jgi:hypothetical protein
MANNKNNVSYRLSYHRDMSATQALQQMKLSILYRFWPINLLIWYNYISAPENMDDWTYNKNLLQVSLSEGGGMSYMDMLLSFESPSMSQVRKHKKVARLCQIITFFYYKKYIISIL